jgi:1,4-dihydroxy-2-naphthoate octaprenyltransferase
MRDSIPYSPAEPIAARAFWRGFWRLADPRITLASVSSLGLGAVAAARVAALSWPWLALSFLGIFAIEVAKNASGEIFDFDSGADLAVAEEDRSPFSGGKRVLVDGLLTRNHTWWIAGAGYALGIFAGLSITLGREPRVLLLGLPGVALAWFYHAPPIRLSYRGLGEAGVAIAYGPLILSGTYLVQRHGLPLSIALLSVPLGILIAAFLWVNEFTDCRADSSVGKRTLVVRLGRPRAARVLVLLYSLAFLLQVLLPLWGWPRGVWWGLVAAPFAFLATMRALNAPLDAGRMIQAQSFALAAFVVLAAGAGAGLLFAG